MRFTWDEEYEIMYIYFDHPDAGKPGSAKEALVDYWPGINVDIGHDGKPLGIEVMSAKRVSFAEVDREDIG
jgi:uncharacterized protein YuzE